MVTTNNITSRMCSVNNTEPITHSLIGLQGESVDGQEAIEGPSIDQLYDEI